MFFYPAHCLVTRFASQAQAHLGHPNGPQDRASASDISRINFNLLPPPFSNLSPKFHGGPGVHICCSHGFFSSLGWPRPRPRLRLYRLRYNATSAHCVPRCRSDCHGVIRCRRVSSLELRPWRSRSCSVLEGFACLLYLSAVTVRALLAPCCPYSPTCRALQTQAAFARDGAKPPTIHISFFHLHPSIRPSALT